MQMKVPLTLAALLLVAAAGYWSATRTGSRRGGGQGAVAGSKADFPDYSHYDFHRAEQAKTVHFGNLPVGASVIFMVESLLRDRTLKAQLESEGWGLRVFNHRSGREALPFADGRMDVQVLGDTVALTAVSRGHTAIFGVIRLGNTSLVSDRRLIPADLKGLRIGYAPGTTLHFALARILEATRLDLKDIVSVPMQPDEMEAALREHRVDAVVTLEPFLSGILARVPGAVSAATTSSYTYLVADKAFAKRNPLVLKAILASLVRAARWGRRDDANLRRALGWVGQRSIQFLGRPGVESTSPWVGMLHRETLDNASFPLLPLTVQSPQSIQHRQFEFLKRAGMIPQESEWSHIRECFEMGALPELMQEAGRWDLDRFNYAPDRLFEEVGQP